MVFSSLNTKNFATSGQSHPFLAPLIAAVFTIGLLLVPVIHSAATASQNIPLFDPSHFTAEQLATSTLNDGTHAVLRKLAPDQRAGHGSLTAHAAKLDGIKYINMAKMFLARREPLFKNTRIPWFSPPETQRTPQLAGKVTLFWPR